MLVAQALSAAAVVVGHRGPHPFQGALIGSLATGLAAHSECPVVVVGEPENPAGPVALGVDGSAAGAAAVRLPGDFRAGCGHHRRARLDGLERADAASPRRETEPYACEPGMLAAEEGRLLAETLAGMCARYPEVRVERSTVHGVHGRR
ncbi:hypothetical protein SLITK23_01140 [Streptomyces lividans]|uniref:UspA domain-containing protein n=3 Tax=Streptomyces TaxID=1883 RepID=Q9RIY7_STRCO|nr:hypothetical protein SLIV_37050 [Streptomyces lividans TK24]EOY44828.1 UspA domain protein [Streptomyces lividans 1326]KKD15391.1 hypothetical protein TR66_10715 [Streptomyces sp. WM6391]PSK61178.1 Universal stress protein [Streptomyces sp. 111WW2]QSJ13904.1 hypothetical protein SLIVDG2_37050 [Streptomyces lividans]TYP06926.1 universal stress protein family protein [Streptomyces coelicolor]TYP08744.1 universal stress protein family protein [Streptomyces coelicolor A3(2)]